MMQTPKYQLPRKPRKLISRDRKDLNSFHGSSRQKSKESEDKKVLDNNSNKPHQLISNLRFQLTNLRQQVAKLSKKDQKKTHHNEVKQQYEARSPKQLKHVRSYYFDDLGATLPDEGATTQRTKSSSQSQVIRVQNQQSSEELQKLKQQVAEVQVKNNQLVKTNNELNNRMKQLGERLRRQYEMKIHQIEVQRQRVSKQRENEENDRTINCQRQILDNKNLIEELKKQVAALSQENEELKLVVISYKNQQVQLNEKKLLINQRDETIQELQVSIKALQIQVETLQQENKRGKVFQAQSNRLGQQLFQKVRKIEDLKSSIQNLVKHNSQLQKKLTKIPQKIEVQLDGRRKMKSAKLQGQPVKQLHEIIAMQQKSLKNQQSDINFLQSQLRKLSFFKHMSKAQTVLLDNLNEEIIAANMKELNKKYNNGQ